MEKLFNDSETFQKERPTKITEQQENEVYSKLANEIIDNGWCVDESEEDIIFDLKHLSRYDSGFEMAKMLEGFNMNCNYEINTDFIYWLDDFEYNFKKVLEQNIKDWVNAKNPKPLFEKGQRLIVTEFINYKLKKDIVVYVNGFREETACYLIDPNPDKEGGIVLAYEDIEKKCIIFKDEK